MKSRTIVQNSIVFGAKFNCIRIFGLRMARQIGQLGAAPGQRQSMEQSQIGLTKSEI
jgi:hypothetical protein